MASLGEEGALRDKDGTARCKGEVVTSIEGGQQGGVGGTPPHHIESCTNHDPPSAEEVDQSCRRTLEFDPSI